VRAYAGYLFDLDGTLVDTAPDLHRALNHALTAHGHRAVSLAHTRHWVGHGARAMVEQALAAELGRTPSDQRIDSVRDTFLPYYEANVAVESRPYPHVLEALELLGARGAKLAVVTNKITRFTERLVAELGLGGYFQALVCGDTTERPKPAADPALHACAALELTVSDVLFVGRRRSPSVRTLSLNRSWTSFSLPTLSNRGSDAFMNTKHRAPRGSQDRWRSAA